MRMRNKLLGGAALLVAAFSLSEANAQTCTAAPTCAQLGYTMKKADCGENPALRCPFALTDDNQVFCGKEAEAVISVGDILYGDGTISKTIISDKIPIGVVFDAMNRLAVALTDVKSDGSAGSETMLWTENIYDIPNLENCTGIGSGAASMVITCGIDGRANTDKILACGSSCGGTPAATACNLYQPVGCTKDFCKKGKWFLPSLRDLNIIYQQNVVIYATLSSLGRGVLLDYYWSSTEFSSSYTWVLGMKTGTRSIPNKDWDDYVRPVVKY